MNIDELTFKEIKELLNIFGGKKEDNSHFIIGEKYFIRTVTMHLTGVLEKVTDKEFVISQAAWIADSGRFSTAISATGNNLFDEVEPFPDGDVIIGRGALIDMTAIPKIILPREKK